MKYKACAQLLLSEIAAIKLDEIVSICEVSESKIAVFKC